MPHFVSCHSCLCNHSDYGSNLNLPFNGAGLYYEAYIWLYDSYFPIWKGTLRDWDQGPTAGSWLYSCTKNVRNGLVSSAYHSCDGMVCLCKQWQTDYISFLLRNLQFMSAKHLFLTCFAFSARSAYVINSGIAIFGICAIFRYLCKRNHLNVARSESHQPWEKRLKQNGRTWSKGKAA